MCDSEGQKKLRQLQRYRTGRNEHSTIAINQLSFANNLLFICATIKIVDYGYEESVKIFEVKDLISFKDIINPPGRTVKYAIRRKDSGYDDHLRPDVVVVEKINQTVGTVPAA